MGKEAIENMCKVHSTQHSLVYFDENYFESSENQSLFNMEYHFGCTTKNNCTQDPQDSEAYKLCHLRKPPLESNVYICGNCNGNMPAVTLGNGHYYPIQFYGTLFRREYLWALSLLYQSTKTDLLTELCANLLVQRLIYLTGSSVRYHLAKSVIDLSEESDKFSVCSTGSRNDINASIVDEIIRIINNLTCCGSNSLLDCLCFSIDDFEELSHIGKSMKTLTETWVAQIETSAYHMPLLTNATETKLDEMNNKEPWNCRQSKIFYHPTKLCGTREANCTQENSHLRHIYQKTCKVPNVTFPKYDEVVKIRYRKDVFRDTMLVILFNWANYHTIPFIELLYTKFFQNNVVFCGPLEPKITQFPELFDEETGTLNRTFVIYDDPGGSTNYLCCTLVMTMGYRVKGYMLLADDVLFNVKQMKQYNLNDIWMPNLSVIYAANEPFKSVYNLNFQKIESGWFHLDRVSARAINSTLYRLHDMAQNQNSFAEECLKNLKIQTNGEYRLFAEGIGDIYYIPAKYSTMAATLFEVFCEYGIFLEIAVPTVLRCLDTKSFTNIRLRAVWDKKRRFPWSHFPANFILGEDAFHPLKWSVLKFRNPVMYEHKDQGALAKIFMCNETLPYLFGHK